jgi:hypothetical protein
MCQELSSVSFLFFLGKSTQGRAPEHAPENGDIVERSHV